MSFKNEVQDVSVLQIQTLSWKKERKKYHDMDLIST